MAARVLVFGTFDLLHPGHISFLREASAFGAVTVALTPDELITTYKGAAPVNDYHKRERRLRQLSLVTDVISADKSPNTYHILKKNKPTMVLLGYDQQVMAKQLLSRIREYGPAISIAVAHPYRDNVYRSSLLRAASTKKIS
ncbi:hypothetical protein COV04_02455 [Candidatus Uhrbacteria bacterium CG10_big_fil_rev_8_21_14_0_10_48_11]|uniref:Cytidyltransferase-like domain-containing protein n=1 Tax=Candidatus Uhrbacteria bacterium CG10_big_fil_rev_8_21_14_0_10_48_11 TaxID=1975037 RepID=A0A2M8LEA6_9BACT|nr:MAG: hypothetical protein COV04_02455 [Candidatus Uhrbacteria bacterium CG10_big_fil_rev_8_21_14_0_10_48_11]